MTICWKCKNSYYGKCSWHTDFTPVKDWVAEPTKIKNYKEYINSYLVLKCPNFEKEDRVKRVEDICKKLDITERVYYFNIDKEYNKRWENEKQG